MHTPPHIAPAHPDDAPAIARIHVAAWQAAYAGLLPADWLAALDVAERTQMWHACITRGHPALRVAQVNGEIAGWICHAAAHDSADPQHAELRALYVAPSHWARGIGRALWQHARQELATAGYTCCHAWVLEGNTRAARFYYSQGYTEHPPASRALQIGEQQVNELFFCTALKKN
ncbi:GNAT family N-acetyltransferase [Andreprevotia lacus]|uniref:GNAT family N-acetyltransferase n=1 Tax=Andreprevotia lacus TaxID=1121000 RepID=UPI001594423F|nr:GNAT family N-acetyltransferase [Andreprevotia lacus]